MQTIATEPLKATYNACSVTVLTLYLRFMVCSQNNWKIHFPATTHLRQLCSCLFSITSSVFHLPLKIPVFWKTAYYPNHASTAQLRKSCPATTDLEKHYDADKMLHAVTTNKKCISTEVPFGLLWSSRLCLKRALKTNSSQWDLNT